MTTAKTIAHPVKAVPARASLPALAAPAPDLVDRMFDYLSAEFPQIAGEQLSAAKSAVRAEFCGEEVYIPARGAVERQRQVAQVLSLFNGRNATDVARQIGISRSSVYRFIKQSRLERNRSE
ncbi:Mor transcription activator family protein [Acidovorax sp. A1169]|uniref:Mor transcription activator family protein n=1 Tax=Acidovorax sp. A1169 TaxID=3059524 RepID=UPI002737B285|nr:Mor transcription activator family protein [Acidovorax sp. A1169]MDP4074956.1 Mor transcription activator family protein [Acidovorax sp. A1169]